MLAVAGWMVLVLLERVVLETYPKAATQSVKPGAAFLTGNGGS